MINWDDLWGQAKTEVQKGLDQFNQVGVPVIQASIEKWALETIEKQHEATSARAAEGIKSLTEGESGPLSQAFQSTIKDAALTNYGGHILFGVVAIGVVGFLLLKK